MLTKERATIDDLYKVEGKAELVNGEIVLMDATGDEPGSAAGEVFVSLHDHARRTGTGRAYGDNVAFLTDLPHRQSFAPDAAYYSGPRAGMKFLPRSPEFAVEVRSEEDYRARAELNRARKRADYFASGTLVVWDVDLESDEVIRVYRSTDPENPTVYRRGDAAEAEPAVPGWTFPVDRLFE